MSQLEAKFKKIAINLIVDELHCLSDALNHSQYSPKF